MLESFKFFYYTLHLWNPLELFSEVFVYTIMIVGSIFVISSKNPIDSILFLILVFLNAAAFLIMFKADFLGLIFVIIYVGAITVLFLFIVMMLDIKKGDKNYALSYYIPFFILVSSLFFTELAIAMKGFFDENILITNSRRLPYRIQEIALMDIWDYFWDYKTDFFVRDKKSLKSIPRYQIMNFGRLYCEFDPRYVTHFHPVTNKPYFIPWIMENEGSIFFRFDGIPSIVVTGQVLFRYYYLCVLLCGFLLLIAMVGSIVLAFKRNSLKSPFGESSRHIGRQYGALNIK